jgi:predicted DNA-binding protein
MASKTKQSGRVDLPIRMSPELKLRIVSAANDQGISQIRWVLNAIERELDDHDAFVADRENVEALRARLATKLEEIIALLVRNCGLGDVNLLSAKDSLVFHNNAHSLLREWREQNRDPKTPLERLCQDYEQISLQLAQSSGDTYVLGVRVDDDGEDDIVTDGENNWDDDDFGRYAPEEPMREAEAEGLDP